MIIEQISVFVLFNAQHLREEVGGGHQHAVVVGRGLVGVPPDVVRDPVDTSMEGKLVDVLGRFAQVQFHPFLLTFSSRCCESHTCDFKPLKYKYLFTAHLPPTNTFVVLWCRVQNWCIPGEVNFRRLLSLYHA
jgi:hypothetical protein